MQEIRIQVGQLTNLSGEIPFIVVGIKNNNVVCFGLERFNKNESQVNQPIPLQLKHFELTKVILVLSIASNEGMSVTG